MSAGTRISLIALQLSNLALQSVICCWSIGRRLAHNATYTHAGRSVGWLVGRQMDGWTTTHLCCLSTARISFFALFAPPRHCCCAFSSCLDFTTRNSYDLISSYCLGEEINIYKTAQNIYCVCTIRDLDGYKAGSFCLAQAISFGPFYYVTKICDLCDATERQFHGDISPLYDGRRLRFSTNVVCISTED
jgi:hypothetical protein